MDQWYGNLPSGWRSTKIKMLSAVMRGASPRPIDDPAYFDDEGDYAWVRISDVTASGGLLTQTDQKLSGLGSSMSVKLEPGSLFLSIAGSVGKPCVTDIPACIHDGFVYFPHLPKKTQRYLYWIFECGDCFSGLGKLGTQLNLNTDTVGSITIPLPPPALQVEISDYLDRETPGIDALIEKKRRLLKLLEEKRVAVITHAVTKGLDLKAPMKDSGIDWFGKIPAHWELKRLKYFSVVYDCKHVTPTYIDDGFPLVSTTEVKPFSLAFSAARQVGEDDFLNMTEGGRLPTRNDIIYSRNVSVGSAARVADEVSFCMGQDLCLIRPAHQVRSEFFEFSLNSNAVLGQIDSLTVGATFKRINVERIRNYWIPLPPDDEQHRIILYLKNNIAHLRRVTTAVEMAIQRLLEYRSALITNAVTGKIDVRDLKNKEAAA
jgi:type I restriction enzyme S subunit